MPRRTYITLALVAALSVLVLAACSGDGSGETVAETPTPEPTAVASATATASDTDTGSADSEPTGIDLEAAVEALDAIATSQPEATPEASDEGEEVIVSGNGDPELEEEESAEPAKDVLFDYLQAVGLLNAGQYKEAVGRYSVVLRIHPDLYLAYHGRALAYYNVDLFDLALDDFDKAIEYKPDYAEALRNRGVLLGNQGQRAAARIDLQRAVDIYREKGALGLMAEALTQLQRIP
jgi:tetratricopeptide (TPR) repeat protein